MIQRVIEQVRLCKSIGHVVVATDDDRIYNHVLGLGAECVMTDTKHPSGTDRCLEAFERVNSDADCVVNVQGDEPFVDPSQLDALCTLISQPEVSIATLAKRISDKETLFDPSKVKVVINKYSQALYFSRQVIPFYRNADEGSWHALHSYYKHLGLYAYKPEKLKTICTLAPSPLEKAESLEQLRWMENGHEIYVGITDIESPAIDTPEDLQNVLTRYFSSSKR